MKTINQPLMRRNRQQGAVLVVSLLMLVVITTLAISGMNTATTELAMARNDQNYEFAFQAAETGLEQALAQESFATGSVTDLGSTLVSGSLNDEYHTIIRYEDRTTPPPDKAFSIGTGAVAHHFVATSTAKSSRAPGSPTDRDSTAIHTQAFYKIGAVPPTTL